MHKIHKCAKVHVIVLITTCADCLLEHHRRVADCFLHCCCHQPVRSIGLHRVWPRHGAALGCQVDLLSWRLKQKKSTNLTRLTNPNHQMYTSLLWVYSTVTPVRDAPAVLIIVKARLTNSDRHNTIKDVLYCDCQDSSLFTDKPTVTAMNMEDLHFSEVYISWR